VGLYGNAKVGTWPKSALAHITAVHIAASGQPWKWRQNAFIDMSAHFQQACLIGHANESSLAFFLRSINDQEGPPFGIDDVFSIETFDDAHGALAFRT
jgi:hypothetical protein